MNYKYAMLILVILFLCMIQITSAANTTYDTEGTDPLLVGEKITDYAYKIVTMLMIFMCLVSGAYALKDSRPSGGMDSTKHGSTAWKMFQGIIICTIILVCGPFIINMIL